jgi:hypothetical protein
VEASLIEILGKWGEEGENSREWEFDTGGIKEVEDFIAGDTSRIFDTMYEN